MTTSNEHNNAPAVPEQELSALLTTSLPYMTPVGRARLGQDIAQLYSSVSAPAVPQGWTDADSDSARLALELECLLMDTKDLSVVSKWWASANEALELHRQRLAATPAPAPAQEFNKSVADAEIKAMYVESQGSDKGWLGIEGSYFIGGVVAARRQKKATAPAQGEPFGHFRAEPFGWTDCAKDDEGAIALYERPQEVVIPQGYEIHELPTDYSGPVWIESQVRYMARQNACASQPTTDTEVGAQEVGLTDEEIEAIAQKHMSTVGDHWCNEEAIRERHAEDFARAIIAALRAKGQS